MHAKAQSCSGVRLMDVEDFIRTWTNASASERQTAQSFVIQLCRVLGVAAPNDEKVGDPDYGFERIVRFLPLTARRRKPIWI